MFGARAVRCGERFGARRGDIAERAPSPRHNACRAGARHRVPLTVCDPHSQEERRLMAKRTTHRSSGGKKLYAVRGKTGEFKDIQTYQRAHSGDLRKKSKSETTKKAKAKAKPKAKRAKKKK
jgi:hypothetical protein